MIKVGILAKDQIWEKSLKKALSGQDHHAVNWLGTEPAPNGSLDDLIRQSTMVWIPEKPGDDMEAASRVIKKSKHLLLGFPVTDFIPDALPLLKLAQEAQVMVQVGHPERNHLAIRSCLNLLDHPRSVFLHHHTCQFPDPDQSLNFMVEMVADLGLVLPLINAPLKRVRSHACHTPDRHPVLIDVRIEFHNGALISLQYRAPAEKAVHRIEIFQAQTILDINLLTGASYRHRIPDSRSGLLNSEIIWEELPAPDPGGSVYDDKSDQLLKQCLAFINTLKKGQIPVSPLEDGFYALEIAHQVQSQICRY